MKKYVLATCLLGMGMGMQAQDTYLNDQMINNAGDVHGTARYVGMGGAMGALGADISTISWNPAGIGMMRRGNISFTAGAAWSQTGIDEQSTTNATLDQAGFVYNVELEEFGLKNFNFAFNYQKKLDFNNAFYADNNNLRGASQMSQLSGIANQGFDTNNNLAGLAVDYGFLTALDANGNVVSNDKTPIYRFDNPYLGERGLYTQHSHGSLNSFDFNFSGNVDDRVYWGVTMGLENLRYRSWSDYYEESSKKTDSSVHGDYSLFNDKAIDGMGFNIKAGVIIRPIEENPLRFGLVVETPTWYQLKSSTLYSLKDQVDGYQTDEFESYLESSIRSPFKLRAGIGSTVSNFLAWDVDYEFANYRSTAMGYPDTYVDDPNSSIFANTWDKAMNQQTKENLKPVHSVRAGIEYKPTSMVALRAGYNYASSAYKNRVSFDQAFLDSYAMDYATSTSFMRMSDVHTLTLGLGFNWRHTNLDIAYKYKNQNADFYAFDTAAYGISQSPSPVNTDLSRHQITATLAFKF